jgi:hypothetical protein
MEIPDSQKSAKTIPQLISVASDGTYYYIYDGFSSMISKIGSGQNGTLAGEVILTSKPVKALIPELNIPDAKKEESPTVVEQNSHLTFSSEKKSRYITLHDENCRAQCESSDSDEYCTVFLDLAFPTQPNPSQLEKIRGHSYFEISISGLDDGRVIGFGWSHAEFSVDGDNMLGWNAGTYAYHSDGEIHGNCEVSDSDDDDDDDEDEEEDEERWPSWHNGDVIGCGIDYDKGRIFYTYNGRFLHNAFALDDDFSVSTKICFDIFCCNKSFLYK